MTIRKPGAKAPATPADLADLAREAVPIAFAQLVLLAQSEDPKIALAASQEILNRAHGKVGATGAGEAPADDLAEISDEELDRRIAVALGAIAADREQRRLAALGPEGRANGARPAGKV